MQMTANPVSDQVTQIGQYLDSQIGRDSLTGGLVEVGQDVVHKSVDDKSGDVVADVDQKLVPALRLVGLGGC